MIREIKDKVFFPLSSFNKEVPPLVNKEIYNLLLYGPSGTGKTSWVYSLYNEVLRPNGYMLIATKYKDYIENTHLSSLVDRGLFLKVCFLINNADGIESNKRDVLLTRMESSLGFRSQISIFTVESLDRFDEAFLRRVNKTIEFNHLFI